MLIDLFIIEHLTNLISHCLVKRTKNGDLVEEYTTGCLDILLESNYCYELNIKDIGISKKGFHLFESDLGYI